MKRTRTLFLAVSLGALLFFTGALLAERHQREDLFRALGNLAEVVHLVENQYVDELNQEALALSLDAGIVESVDRWAAVLPPDQVEPYMQLMQSPPAFGLCLGVRLASAAVRHTLAGSPASQAGLESWEVIEAVDGVNTRGRPLWQIRLELARRETAGEAVTLTVVDRRVDQRRNVVLEATPWTPDPVSVEDLDGVRVLRLESLPEGSAAALAKHLGDDIDVILDLRQLVWGFEDQAIAVADLFVGSGVLGSWKGNRAGEKVFEASEGTATDRLPIVLTSPNTEGVGESLAAALQRAGATLVGHKSAGHAPHMQLVTDGDINLWLPVAQWLRPDETPIANNGVEPQEVVELTEAEEDEDPVLQRALEIIRPAVEEAV